MEKEKIYNFFMNVYTLATKLVEYISYTTIDSWYKKGYEGLKLTTLRKLAAYFNTTLDYWFLNEITDPDYNKSLGFKIKFAEMEHLKKYRILDIHSRESVNTILERESQRVEALTKLQGQLSYSNRIC